MRGCADEVVSDACPAVPAAWVMKTSCAEWLQNQPNSDRASSAQAHYGACLGRWPQLSVEVGAASLLCRRRVRLYSNDPMTLTPLPPDAARADVGDTAGY